jgi:hypothetical protein
VEAGGHAAQLRKLRLIVDRAWRRCQERENVGAMMGSVDRASF